MFNFDLVKDKFPELVFENEALIVENQNIIEVLDYLKNTSELVFDELLSIIAVDYREFIELNYLLYSTDNNEKLTVKTRVNDIAETVVNIYKSAFYDECEIYDMFGVQFRGNVGLKRLFMPSSWKGHPMRKDYSLKDERLAWND